MASATDDLIWDRAIELGAVLITKDEDFAARAAIAENAPSILWIRLGNTSRQALIVRLGQVLEATVKLLDLGERLIELR